MSLGILVVLAISMAARTVLLALLLRQQRYRDFPIFFAYIAFNWVSTLVMFVLQSTGHAAVQIYWYWSDEAISIGLDCWVVVEIYQRVMSRYPETRNFGTGVLRVTSAVMVVAAVSVFAFGSSQVNDRFYRDVLIAARSVKLAQLFLVSSLLGFCTLLRVPLGRTLRWLAVGFGQIAAINLVAFAVLAQFGGRVALSMNYVLMINFVFAELVWLYAFVRTNESAVAGPVEVTDDVNRWKQALSEVVER